MSSKTDEVSDAVPAAAMYLGCFAHPSEQGMTMLRRLTPMSAELIQDDYEYSRPPSPYDWRGYFTQTADQVVHAEDGGMRRRM